MEQASVTVHGVRNCSEVKLGNSAEGKIRSSALILSPFTP